MKRNTLLFVVLLIGFSGLAQKIKPQKGYSPQIGAMVNMLEDLKGRVTRNVRGIGDNQTDFLWDEESNRIGALIMHLAATEAVYQVLSFEDRQFNEEEDLKWGTALRLGDKARKEIKGKPIAYYLNIWDEVRKKTLSSLKTKDDTWFSENMSMGMNHHWAWFHVMEHQANHMGQIVMILKRAP